MKTRVIRWTMEITPQTERIYSAESILNTRSEEYASFIESIITMLENAGYLLNEDHSSNQQGSVSQYYEFLKFREDATVKLVLSIRISDHKSPDRIVKGRRMTAKQRRQEYLDTTRSAELMQDFSTTNRPISIPVDIIFNNQHFLSYIEAIKYIHQLINQLD